VGNIILVQNVVSRIAHGLIGLDLFSQRGEETNYLKDFLTLKATDLEQALASAPGATKLVPNSKRTTFEEWAAIVERVLKAQRIIKDIRNVDRSEIEHVAKDMQEVMQFFYSQL